MVDFPIVAKCLKFDPSWTEPKAVAVMTGAASAFSQRRDVQMKFSAPTRPERFLGRNVSKQFSDALRHPTH